MTVYIINIYLSAAGFSVPGSCDTRCWGGSDYKELDGCISGGTGV